MNLSHFLPTSRTLLWTLGAVIGIVLASFVGYLNATLLAVFFFSTLAIAAVVIARHPDWAVPILIAETIIGGKGYLFSFALHGYDVSWRLALFVVVVVVWAATRLHDRHWRIWQSPYRWFAGLFLAMMVWGVLHALTQHNLKIGFFDANGYLYFGLLFMVFDLIRDTAQVKRLAQVVLGVSVGLALLTLFVFSYFSFFSSGQAFVEATRLSAEQLAQLGETPETAQLGQSLSASSSQHVVRTDDLLTKQDLLYRWLKDDGLGEVAYLGGSFFRIFLYSHLWVVVLSIWSIVATVSSWRTSTRARWWWLLIAAGTSLTLIVSFSRSLLLGYVVGLFVGFFFLPRRYWIKVSASVGITLVVLIVLMALVLPHTFQVATDRITSVFNPDQEIASQTRSQLLPPVWQKIGTHPIIGNGFGTTVVIPTFVPGTDTVKYQSVYLFEWTYLDVWVKVGIAGVAVFVLLFITLIRRLYARYRDEHDTLTVSLLLSLLAFMIINISTPYLNHPIGIALLVFAAVVSITATPQHIHD